MLESKMSGVLTDDSFTTFIASLCFALCQVHLLLNLCSIASMSIKHPMKHVSFHNFLKQGGAISYGVTLLLKRPKQFGSLQIRNVF